MRESPRPRVERERHEKGGGQARGGRQSTTGTLFERARQKDGQAIAELAIFAPVMLLLMLLAVDFGRLFFSYIAVHNAAREATSYAAMNAASSTYDADSYNAATVAVAEGEANVQEQGSEGSLVVSHPYCYAPSAPGTGLDCNVASNFATGTGNRVRVDVQQSFTFLTPVIGQLFGGSLTLTADATAAILNPLDASILPDPDATEEPTPDPDATPDATPTAEPSCTVPDYKNTFFLSPDALATWGNAGFTGTLTDDTDGNRIKDQTIKKNTDVPCTSDMTVSD